MKALYIAFYGCLSEGINCSLTKQKVRVWKEISNAAKLSVVIFRILKLPLYCKGEAYLVFIWTFRSAVCCGDCKMFYPVSRTRPPSDLHPGDIYSVRTSHRSRFVQKLFLAAFIWQQRWYIYSTYAVRYVNLYTYFSNIERLVGQNK
jgi:hypothetical protein